MDRATRQKIRDVSPEEAFVIIGTSSRLGNPVVIDVRTPAEYAGGHIHRAMNIDVNSTEFRDKINTLDKNVTYVVYCRSGGRSDMARDIMEEMGFRNVINVTGGFSDWEAAGLPVER
ncbi:MAG: hypothetical protein A2137_07945 [Chloroflexi bacterium RBG_16_58_8]|nr:MAG: hypothetical protein A2137_07945 [Chloroflexi bacterium RBG_16_58_8]